jgi:hypothetical protein
MHAIRTINQLPSSKTVKSIFFEKRFESSELSFLLPIDEPWPALFTDPATDDDANIDSTNITEKVTADAECQMFLLIKGWTLKVSDS